jgi:threonine dehydrogenase-like Zn-dependent dehydrogenase
VTVHQKGTPVKAVVYYGKQDVRVVDVRKPRLKSPRDAIIKVAATAICGSDLHLYDHAVVGMRRGDIMGHEFMGTVEQVGKEVTHVAVGDRVIVPFIIACGRCWYCERGLVASCDTSNPNGYLVKPFYGSSPAGMFGYTKFFGGYAGGQAEYVRVPFADVGLFKVPDGITDDQALMVTDILPTAYQAVLNCGIGSGDTVAIAGAGPVGQLAARCAVALGAGKVIVIDSVPERLELAAAVPGVVTIDYTKTKNLHRALAALTDGRGPDAAIDAVGMASSGRRGASAKTRLQQLVLRQRDKPKALRQLIKSVRKGGTVSVVGIFAGIDVTFPLGMVFAKGITVMGGQTHVHTHVEGLFELIASGKLDPTPVITQHLPLDDAPMAYRKFKDREPGFVKVVLRP